MGRVSEPCWRQGASGILRNERQGPSLCVCADLGEGTFAYEGLHGSDIPEMSVWLFNMYGGMKLSGDPLAPHDEYSLIGGITATREGLAKFLRLLDPELQPTKQFRAGV